MDSMEHKFTIEQLRPMRDGMTLSRDAWLGSENGVTYFSLGKDTSISQEIYDSTAVYTEVIIKKEHTMNNLIISGEVIKLTANGKFKMALLLVLE